MRNVVLVSQFERFLYFLSLICSTMSETNVSNSLMSYLITTVGGATVAEWLRAWDTLTNSKSNTDIKKRR